MTNGNQEPHDLLADRANEKDQKPHDLPPDRAIENVIIVGGACAGYSAALYTSRANLDPLVIEGFQWGGQLQNTTDVENYPGFPEGIMGPELMAKFREQAERFGTRFVTDDATRIELSDGGVQRVWVNDEEHLAKSVILAMGAEPKRLGVPGEIELGGRGVSTCGVCDGAFFKGEDVIVVGGGDSAMEDSIFISKFAERLTIVHRRDEFRASKIMLERAREIDNIDFKTPFVVDEFVVGDDGKIGSVRLKNSDTGETEEMEVGGAFVAIGHTPRSELVTGQVDTDENGYVLTRDGSTTTKLAGVFAAGDLVDHTYRQAATAAGTGVMSALDAEWYLRDTPPSPEAHWAGKAGVAQEGEPEKTEKVEA
jgi:thioredoxin reductase (NADPH)